jgi:hypothetical protein
LSPSHLWMRLWEFERSKRNSATVEKILSSLEAGEPLQETRKTMAQGVSVFTAEDGNALRHALAPSLQRFSARKVRSRWMRVRAQPVIQKLVFSYVSYVENEGAFEQTRLCQAASWAHGRLRRIARHGAPRPDILAPRRQRLSLSIPCHVHWPKPCCHIRKRWAAMVVTGRATGRQAGCMRAWLCCSRARCSVCSV